ncbi:MAG: LLM class flavin-dependent oxidoreductase [Thermoleophilia bacterium]
MAFPLSILDVSPIPSGATAADALRNTIDLARLADRAGYHRYWLAEHHNSAGIASAVPELMIGYVAGATERLRVGSGGVMLPNHAPLRVAEAFGMLESLHPGRIDLGVGRAPGTDHPTAVALRGSREALGADDFPERLSELRGFLDGGFPPDHPYHRVRAVTSGDGAPPVWMLGSSDYGARLAAELGLGFAFAHHINPGLAVPALNFYREYFRPARPGDRPWAILATSVVTAPTADEAAWLAASLDLMWLRIGRGESAPVPSPEEARDARLTPLERERVEANRARHTVGDPATVAARLTDLVERSAADELMAMTIVYDHAARRRSYELLAGELIPAAPARSA